MKTRIKIIKFFSILVPFLTVACASVPHNPKHPDADVIFVKATYNANSDTWIFDVTIQHPDTGWDDYADGWNLVTTDGEILKTNLDSPFTRLLTHPHVDEQPFTRSQSGIVIPEGVTQINVRAHDIVDDFGGAEIMVDLSQDQGAGFEISR